jgi:hypothetical protein
MTYSSTRSFIEQGYILDVNRDLLGNANKPLKANRHYSLRFDTVRKFIPKKIKFMLYKNEMPQLNSLTVFIRTEYGPKFYPTEMTQTDDYQVFEYETHENEDPENYITVQGDFVPPTEHSGEKWEMWKKFFTYYDEQRHIFIPPEFTMIRISRRNGRYNSNKDFEYRYSGPTPTPDNTYEIWFDGLTYINGETMESATQLPNNLELYIRTLSRVNVHVKLYYGFTYYDKTYTNGITCTTGSNIQFESYITSEEIGG